MSIGAQLKRAELMSVDSDGNKIRRVHRHAVGYTVMPVKETPPHALSHANTNATEQQNEMDVRERESRAKFDALDALDREILRLHLIRTERVERTMLILPENLGEYERADWYMKKTARDGRLVIGRQEAGQLHYDEIGRRVGVDERTVRRRLARMSPLMVHFAEAKGWAT